MRSFRFWLRILGGAFAATLCITAAHARSRMDRPVSEVQAALGKILGCTTWEGTANDPGCGPLRTGFATDLTHDAADGTVETIETGGILQWDDKRDPKQGAVTRRTMQEVFAYLFPQWRERKTWLDRAFRVVLTRKKSMAKIGNVTILVQYLHPADHPVTVAYIIATKQTSLDKWWIDNE